LKVINEAESFLNIFPLSEAYKWTNRLPYFVRMSVTKRVSFITLTPAANVIKNFTAVSYDFS
jgi:hypothetical protein